MTALYATILTIILTATLPETTRAICWLARVIRTARRQSQERDEQTEGIQERQTAADATGAKLVRLGTVPDGTTGPF